MKTFRWYGMVLLCLLCLAGCGREEVVTEEGKAEVPAVDWKTNGFAVSEEVQKEQALWALEHIKWQHEDVPGDTSSESRDVTDAGVYEDGIYRIYRILNQEQPNGEEKDKYLLEIYDTSSMQAAVTAIDTEKLDIGNGFISGMGVIGQGEYVFRVLEYGREEGSLKLLSHYLVYSDLGENTRKVDVLPVYIEKGVANKVYSSECICDAAGNSYTRAGYPEYPFKDLYILDRDGNLLLEHKGNDYDEISAPLQMVGGELVFPIYNDREKTTRLVWFDVEEKEEHTIADFEKESLVQAYGIQGNDVYYQSFYGIMKWDIVSGDRTLVYNFDENGVSRVYSTMLVLREGEAPILRMYGTINYEEEDWLVVMSDQETELPDETRIASLATASSRVQNCVSVASRRNPDFYFTYETYAETGKDDFRTRIVAEMVAGGGPDILYVSLEDMKALQGMGLLKDLRSVLPEEELDQIIPGVLELGTVDGTLVGLAPEMDVRTAVTLKSIWNQDTWSLEDILALMDTGNFTGIFCQGSTSFAPQALLSLLTSLGLQDSSLVDWEAGESHFESELFLEIMEAAKTYGDNPIRTDVWLGEGGCPGMLLGMDLKTFEEIYEQYGEDVYFVGEPTKGSSGSYVVSDGVLVVNNNISDSEAAAAYLECLLRDEIQYPSFTAYGLSVLKVSPEDVETFEWDGETRYYWKESRLMVREDGTTALGGYKDFLEGCVPGPVNYDDVIAFVWEDAQSYIMGDKSAEEVAQVIDSRIQLYLDERN